MLLLGLTACGTSMRRDQALQPKPQGTRLTALGFVGPGIRATVDNRVDLEPGSSQLRSQLRGDANLGYAEVGGHMDLRWLVFSIGGSAAYRHAWHSLRFEPGPDGLDHGESELSRKARVDKDEDDDYPADTWFNAEGRFRLVAPWESFIAISTVSYRHELRKDETYSWEYATVYDRGGLINWETQLLLRHRHLGFIGPTFRFLNVPYRDDRRNELQYGIAAGTTPGWSAAEHLLLLRVYTNAGFDDELFGQHFYRIPIQLTVGYQQDFEL